MAKITVDVGYEDGGFSKASKSIQTQAKAVAKSIREISEKTEELENVLTDFSVKAGIAFASFTAGIGISLKAFADFEDGLISVSKTTDLSGASLEKFGDRIQRLAIATGISSEQLLQIATAAGQLGVASKDLDVFTETIAKLGKTTNLQGEQAALTITRILQVSGDGVGDIQRFGNAIVALGNDFAAQEGEIANVAIRVAQSTGQFKLGSANVLAISTALKALGENAEAGGSQVGLAFQTIGKAIEEGGDKFKLLQQLTGLTGDQLTKTFATDATKVFQLFIKGLGNADAAGIRINTNLAKLGLTGIRSSRVLGTLAKSSNVLEDALRLSNNEFENGNALNEEFEKTLTTLNTAFGRFFETITSIARGIGKTLAPVVVTLLNSFTALFEFIANNKVFTDFIALFLSAGAIITGVATAALTAGLAIIKLGKALEIANVILKVVGLSMRALVGASGIGLLIVVIGTLILNWDEFTSFLGDAFSKASKVVIKIAKGIETVLEGVFGKEFTQLIKTVFLVTINSVVTRLTIVFNIFKSIATFIAGGLVASFNIVRNAVIKFIDTILLAGSFVAKALGIDVNKVKDGLRQITGAFSDEEKKRIDIAKKSTAEIESDKQKAAAATRKKEEDARAKLQARIAAQRAKDFEKLNADLERLSTASIGQLIFDTPKTAKEQRDQAAFDLGGGAERGIAIGANILTTISKGAEGAREAVIQTLEAGATAAFGPVGKQIGQIIRILADPQLQEKIIAFTKELPKVLTTIITNAFSVVGQTLIAQAPELIAELLSVFIPLLIDQIVQFLPSLIDAFIENLPLILDALINGTKDVIQALISGIPAFFIEFNKKIPELVAVLAREIPPALTFGMIELFPFMIGALAQEFIKSAIPLITSSWSIEMVRQAPTIIRAIADGIRESLRNVGGNISGGFGLFARGGIVGAADGAALIRGGIPFRDSVPVLAQEGELIVPRNNFAEVVNAVASQRNERTGEGNSGGSTNITITGDILGNEEFIDGIMERISNNMQFRNGSLGLE